MNKIIPILSLIISALALAVSICGVILISVAVSEPRIAFLAVPVILTAAGLSASLTMLNAFFRKSLLCKIAMFIAIGGLVMSIAAIIVWLCVL